MISSLFMISSLLFTGTKDVEATCYNPFGIELSTTDNSSDVQFSDDTIDTDGAVSIMCGTGKYPRGWMNLKNTATIRVVIILINGGKMRIFPLQLRIYVNI